MDAAARYGAYRGHQGPTFVPIAGESAAFTIAIPSITYDRFQHD